MELCETCRNRGSAWCRSCDRIAPGLERFDFYQKIHLEKENGLGKGADKNELQS